MIRFLRDPGCVLYQSSAAYTFTLSSVFSAFLFSNECTSFAFMRTLPERMFIVHFSPKNFDQ